jgi:hypothetical protein
MGALVADSVANANEEGTFMVNQTTIFMVNASLKIMVKAALTGPVTCIDRGKSPA